jgi:hypothetical protein
VAVASAPAAAASVTLNNAGSYDAFIIQYDSSGTLQWARRIGGVSIDTIRSVTTDSSGNIIVSGDYSSSPVTIYDTDGTSEFTTLTNAGSYDTFIVKYNSSGTPQWARQIGGTDQDLNFKVTTDSSGNIIVGGAFSSNPISIYDSSASFTTLTRTGNNADAYIVKYNSSGTPQWARRIAGTGNDQVNSIATDSSGNIFAVLETSSFPAAVYGSNTSFNLPNTIGGSDVFVLKYDSSGTFQWSRQIGGSGNDNVYSIVVDSNGNIIVGGTFTSNPVTIFDSSASFTRLTNAGSTDGYIVKYDSSGTPQWARQIGGSGNDTLRSLSVDSNGNVVVVGFYASNPMSIYGSVTSFTTLSNQGNFDGLIVKYDSSGTPLWTRKIAGIGYDDVRGVGVDSTGNIIVAGVFNSSTMTIYDTDGTSTFTTLTNPNTSNNDGFIVKYSSSGTPQSAKRFGGTGDDSLNTLTIDSTGNIIVAGGYASSTLTIT